MTVSSNYPDLDALLEHRGWVRSLTRSLVSDVAAAEDLEQRTWLAVIEHPPANAQNPRAWLGRVVRNFAGMHWRENKSRRRREETVATRRWHWESKNGSSAQPDELTERMETFGKLAQAVVNLPPPFGPTIFLRFFEELTIGEMATRMKVSESITKTRISRGLEMLRQELKSSLGKDWHAKCLVFAVPLAAAPTTTIATIMTMTIKTKSILAASSIALISLLATFPWDNASELDASPTSSQPFAVSAGNDLEISTIPSEVAEITRVPSDPSVSKTAEQPLDPNLALNGIVVDARGAPIAYANIEIYKPLHRHSSRVRPFSEPVADIIERSTCDSEGRFRVRLEPGRTFDLSVTADGYGTRRLPNLYAGESIRIEMTMAAQIHGLVMDEITGIGIPNARVIATPGVLSVPGQGTYETVTDASGSYTLSDLPAHYVTLAAFASGYVYAHSYTAFVLQPGQEIRQSISLKKGGFVYGRIFDANTKEPIEGAIVRTRLHSVDQSSITDVDGKYILEGIDPLLRERIYATAPGYGRYDWTLSNLIPEAGLEINLGLLPGRVATGQIVDSEGLPIKGAYVAANLRYTRPVYLDIQADYLYTRTNENGAFRLEDLRADLRHSLLVAAEGFGSEVFDFPESEWAAQVLDLGNIVLDEAASAAGRVMDPEGKPVPGIWVTLSGESARRDELGPVLEGGEGYSSEPGFGMGTTQAHTDERGRFSFSDLPSGDYSLWAGAKGYARGAEGTLHLDAGENVAGMQLTLDSGLFIRGTLLDSSGQPIAGASVSAELPGEYRQRVTYNLTASDGSFSLAGLEPMEYTLRCDEGLQRSRDGLGKQRRFSEVRLEEVAAGTEGIQIVLPSALLTTGVIVGPDGAPVPGAIVYEKSFGGESPEETYMPWLATADERGAFTIWVTEGTSKEIFVYPSLHDPTNHYGVMQYHEDGKVDFSYELAVSIPSGTAGLVIELPEVPPLE